MMACMHDVVAQTTERVPFRLSDIAGEPEGGATVVAAGELTADVCPETETFALAVVAVSAARVDDVLAACSSWDTVQAMMGNQVADHDDARNGEAASKMSSAKASSVSSCITFNVRARVALTSFAARVGTTPASAFTIQWMRKPSNH
jgi:hypothetical protein